MTTTGFALVGSGLAARMHARAISALHGQGARCLAVASRIPKQAVADSFGVPSVTLADVLSNPDIQVVCICSPSGNHVSEALAALRAGKHVIVEKPMALNLADADAMIDTARSHGRLLAVALQRRAEPLFRLVRQALDSGDLGTLTLGSITIPYNRSMEYYDSAAWRGTWAHDGGGVLMNQGIHLLDLLLWYFGDPVHISAQAGTLLRSIEVEDSLTANLRFASGAMATITATTTATPGFPHRLEIYGDKGGIQIEGETPARWELADPASATVTPPATRDAADAAGASDPAATPVTGHVNLIRNFLDTLGGKAELLVDGAEGRRSLKTVLDIYAASGLPGGG